VTIGSVEKIVDYLERLISLFTSSWGVGWQVPTIGLDQAIHNYLVYSGALSKLVVFKNDDGPVFTVGIEKRVATNREGQVINGRGVAPAVVHQYDRHWEIAKLFYSRQVVFKHDLSTLRAKVSGALRENAPAVHSILVKAKSLPQRSNWH
jgi:hypothetical protein